jgi:hypothetical protein
MKTTRLWFEGQQGIPADPIQGRNNHSRSIDMIDALKFAFEILIVGALALPWLAILMRIFPADAGSSPYFYLSIVPKQAQNAVAVAVVIAFGYVMGSAVSRVSRNFFNDELWIAVPTEDRIRDAVYTDEYCREHLLRDLSLPSLPPPSLPNGDALHPKWFCSERDTLIFRRRVQELFGLQEGALLLTGQDKVDRLRQYYDQITVLRGAAFNGFILFAVSAFGLCGNFKARWSGKPFLGSLAFLPAVVVLFYGCYSLWVHFSDTAHSPYSHPPFAEFVLSLLGVIGLFVTAKAETATLYFRTCVLAAVLAIGSFGGWWWTEIMYDLQVIHSRPGGYIEATSPLAQ